MITYLRNCILVLIAQALIVMFCLNLAVVPRLGIVPFHYGEVFIFCTIFMVLTHSMRLSLMLNTVDSLKTVAENIALMQFNIANLTLKKLDVINETLREGPNMKLKDVKPLDKPTMTVEQIAKKHNVSVEAIEKELKAGVEVESEHTSDKKVAEEIALDHLMELPDYYTRLKVVEK